MADDIWARVDEAIDTDPLQLRDIVAELLRRAETAEAQLVTAINIATSERTERQAVEAERDRLRDFFEAMTHQRDTLNAAAQLALAALEGAETSCRYHGENPPKAPTWHGGCESCRQPTRVREALAAIRALTASSRDSHQAGGE